MSFIFLKFHCVYSHIEGAGPHRTEGIGMEFLPLYVEQAYLTPFIQFQIKMPSN
ncbi:Cystathionine beta-synthase [Cytobacillus firmus]|uniref:Cystathionine beta-synthase n=1 Tax=Cytobacillus firmus TaxID=1399 RepID=A0A380XC02_CYTFI|nr:Cystathionine beta-synthase [Cytobacillus firmus]SUV00453.1 Uncharacterised protein [Cytobacillus firmus]